MAAITLVVATAGAALGVTATIGNDAIDRSHGPDSWTKFTVVDTNNPAMFEGYFDEVTFYAGRTGTINFVVVDESFIVTYVSEDIPVNSTGEQTVQLVTPAGVTPGDNLGYYTHLNGVIDYTLDANAEDVLWENNNSGKPGVGDGFVDVAHPYTNNNRVYSMNAMIYASSPDICKKGGWESYGYKNQGQCIASIVASDNAAPHAEP